LTGQPRWPAAGQQRWSAECLETLQLRWACSGGGQQLVCADRDWQKYELLLRQPQEIAPPSVPVPALGQRANEGSNLLMNTSNDVSRLVMTFCTSYEVVEAAVSALYLCNKLYSFQPIAARLALLQLAVKPAACSTQAPVITGPSSMMRRACCESWYSERQVRRCLARRYRWVRYSTGAAHVLLLYLSCTTSNY